MELTKEEELWVLKRRVLELKGDRFARLRAQNNKGLPGHAVCPRCEVESEEWGQTRICPHCSNKGSDPQYD